MEVVGNCSRSAQRVRDEHRGPRQYQEKGQSERREVKIPLEPLSQRRHGGVTPQGKDQYGGGPQPGQEQQQAHGQPLPRQAQEQRPVRFAWLEQRQGEEDQAQQRLADAARRQSDLNGSGRRVIHPGPSRMPNLYKPNATATAPAPRSTTSRKRGRRRSAESRPPRN